MNRATFFKSLGLGIAAVPTAIAAVKTRIRPWNKPGAKWFSHRSPSIPVHHYKGPFGTTNYIQHFKTPFRARVKNTSVADLFSDTDKPDYTFNAPRHHAK